MKLRYVLPLLACTAALAAPVVGPLGVGLGKPVTLSKYDATAVGAMGCDGINPICIYFFVTTSEGEDGLRFGEVLVGNLYQSSGPNMTCRGEAYADALKFDEKTLKFTINVALDPVKDPTCTSDSQGAIVVNISGAPNGTASDSRSGSGVTTTPTSKIKYTFESNSANTIATGFNGYVNGNYPGSIAVSRSANRTKVN